MINDGTLKKSLTNTLTDDLGLIIEMGGRVKIVRIFPEHDETSRCFGATSKAIHQSPKTKH